jgi:hypothetical protein
MLSANNHSLWKNVTKQLVTALLANVATQKIYKFVPKILSLKSVMLFCALLYKRCILKTFYYFLIIL